MISIVWDSVCTIRSISMPTTSSPNQIDVGMRGSELFQFQ